jgi:asparagine synthase (glutamine-hydrolysing)
MCGIAGIVEKRENRELLEKMLDEIEHRGPDGKSFYQEKAFALGHRRLSVIDLRTGDQPIYNENKTLSITFNGEIYNFRELREELEKKGHQFSTQTDTEVILHLFEEKGVKAFNELNGYFAFALFDHRENKLFLVRDHFGIKPLHYYHENGKFIYASEIKSIIKDKRVLRKLNSNGLHQQLNLRYNQLDETLFKNIFRVPPGSYLLVDENSEFKLKKYYELPFFEPEKMSEEEAKQGILEKLRAAVKRQMISDVPLGLYLSGGIDSGSLVALASEISDKPVKTFTMGFNEPTDEFEEARLVAKMYGTDHHEILMTPEPLQNMEKAIWHAEEPKINLIQGFMMSKELRNHVTVALSGLGGDELFAGYDIYSFFYPFKNLFKYVPQFFSGNLASSVLFSFNKNLGNFQFDEYRRGLELGFSFGNIEKFYLNLRNVWDFNQKMFKNIYSKDFLGEIFPVSDSFSSFFEGKKKFPLETIQFTELKSKMLNDYLLTEDRMSMANSIEQRVPFLDKELVEFALKIPMNLKHKNGISKYILRKTMENHLPQKNLSKKKWGFTFNPYLQFQKDLKKSAEETLTEKNIKEDGIFNYSYIKQILDHKPHPRMRWHYNYLWLLVGFYHWKKVFEIKN